jgi:sulfate adenylyltransferase subunit 1 (EFTu-like GTPase family)
VAILLVDARHGLRPQSHRHARIARLLGISTFVLAVNKMDLVEFDREIFEGIRAEFAELLGAVNLHAIPMSALLGDNVTTTSERTPWFTGPALLEFLETVDIERGSLDRPFRFPVQLVLRPDHEFRGYAGQVLSGTVRAGDTITAWPSGRQARVSRIVTFDGDLELAFAPMSVTLVLDQEIDISRGDLIVHGDVQFGTRFEADVVWMDERPLDPERTYLLKHGTRTVSAEVDRELSLNQIGKISITSSRPLIYDLYSENRANGAFILIDPSTNFTAGAGMISGAAPDRPADAAGAPTRIGMAERLAYLARSAASDREAVEAVRRLLEDLL